jgi:hypothetical protein
MAQIERKPASYRLFWTNKAGRIATAPDVVEARDDAEAIREAERMAQGRAVEIWECSRRVAMLNGTGRL